jgi:hypothetical protein
MSAVMSYAAQNYKITCESIYKVLIFRVSSAMLDFGKDESDYGRFAFLATGSTQPLLDGCILIPG